MALLSDLFRADARLQQLAVVGSRPIEPGCSGFFVSRLHGALMIVGDAPLAGSDVAMAFFGQSTAHAVAAWKRARLLPPRASRHEHNRYSDERLFIRQPVLDARIDREAILRLDAEMVAYERRTRAAPEPA
jgi:hypothetical protein